MATIQPSSISKEEVNDKNPYSELNNLLIVTGNGFDLACGLPTRYCDFFNRLIDNSFNSSDKKLSSILNTRDYDFIDKNCSYSLFVTPWEYYLYFRYKEINNPEHLKWFNFEEQIQKFFDIDGYLGQITYYLDKMSTNGWHLPNEHNEYTIFLHALYRLHSNDIYDIFEQKVNYSGFYNALSDELIKFEQKFGKYLNDILTKNSDKYDKRRVELFNQIIAKVDSEIGKCKEPLIFTFNYTSLPSKLPYKIKYVHGDLKNAILGFSDDSIGNREELKLFTKQYKRNQKASLFPTYNKMLQDETYNVAFYGLSFGYTDYSDFESIFRHVDLNGGDKILLCYSGDRENETRESFRNVFNRFFPNFGLSYDVAIQDGYILICKVEEND